MNIKDAENKFNLIDKKLINKSIKISNAYHDILKLEKKFDSQQKINTFHLPFGFGAASLIDAKPLGQYINHAQNQALRANKKEKHGYKKIVKLAQRASKLSQTKRNDNEILWSAYEYIRGIKNIKHYMTKGYTNKKQLFFNNLFGIKLESNKVIQSQDREDIIMPLSSNILRCTIKTDLNDLEHGQLHTELKELKAKKNAPVQESLL